MMFYFFHRTPKIYLDCFTNDSMAYRYAPIVKMSKTVPNWFKNVSRSYPNFNFDTLENPKNNTIKNCYGFLELYKRGVVIESWCDLVIKVTHEGYQYFNSSGTPPSEHPKSQRGEGFKNFHHMKLVSPWMFRENSGTKFLSMGTEWSLESYKFKMPPGIVDYKINSATNVNIMLPMDNYEFTIKIGQPLLQILPISEKELQFKNHLVTENEIKKMFAGCAPDRSFWGWRSLKNLEKRNTERKNTCPFSGE